MRRLIPILGLLVTVWPGLAGAQSNATDGALDGFVRDPSGATVPAAPPTST